VRKLLVGFVTASVTVALATSGVEAREALSGGPSRQLRNQVVRYRVTTTCRRAFLRSNPGGPTTALWPQTKTVHGGSVSFVKTVRPRAAFRQFTVVARCNNRKGRRIGTTRLTVVPVLAHTGVPILPLALLATGLLGAGGLLLLAGRRRPRAPSYSARGSGTRWP
jgi:hypothetical protein